jgi:hypothetical protein
MDLIYFKRKHLFKFLGSHIIISRYYKMFVFFRLHNYNLLRRKNEFIETESIKRYFTISNTNIYRWHSVIFFPNLF